MHFTLRLLPLLVLVTAFLPANGQAQSPVLHSVDPAVFDAEDYNQPHPISFDLAVSGENLDTTETLYLSGGYGSAGQAYAFNPVTASSTSASFQGYFSEGTYSVAVENSVGTTVGFKSNKVYTVTSQLSSSEWDDLLLQYDAFIIDTSGPVEVPTDVPEIFVKDGCAVTGWISPPIVYLQGNATMDFSDYSIGQSQVLRESGAKVYDEGVEMPDYGHVVKPLDINPAPICLNSESVVESQPASLVINVVGPGAVESLPDAQDAVHYQRVFLTAVPDAGAVFSGWSGQVEGDSLNEHFTMSQGDNTVTATFESAPEVTVNVSVEGPGQVEVTPQKATYYQGETITLTATPDSDLGFDAWSGDVESSDPEITVTLTDDLNLTAAFHRQVAVNISVLGSGHVEVTPQKPVYSTADTITLTAIPDSNFGFDAWSGDVYSSDPEITVTLTGDLNLTAAFHREVAVDITIQGTGSVEVSPEKAVYQTGETLTFTAVPHDIGSFYNWILPDGTRPNSTELVITLTEDLSLTAVFKHLNLVDFSVRVEGPGSVSVSPEQQYYQKHSQVILEATPEPGAYFAGWSGPYPSANPLTVNLKRDTEIVAVFREITGNVLSISAKHPVPADLPEDIIDVAQVLVEGISDFDYKEYYAALDSSGKLHFWGENWEFDGAPPVTNTFIDPLPKIVAIDSYRGTFMALSEDGHLFMWITRAPRSWASPFSIYPDVVDIQMRQFKTASGQLAFPNITSEYSYDDSLYPDPALPKESHFNPDNYPEILLFGEPGDKLVRKTDSTSFYEDGSFFWGEEERGAFDEALFGWMYPVMTRSGQEVRFSTSAIGPPFDSSAVLSRNEGAYKIGYYETFAARGRYLTAWYFYGAGQLKLHRNEFKPFGDLPIAEFSGHLALLHSGPPEGTTLPRSRETLVGADTVLVCHAVGTGAMTYQWRKDGVDIPNATKRFHRLEQMQLADSGVYTCVVTVPDGGEELGSSQIAVVAHDNPVEFTEIPDVAFDSGPITLSATAPVSNLPVTFEVVSGPATVSGDTLSITGAGEITVRAIQGGNSFYGETLVEQTFLAGYTLEVIAHYGSVSVDPDLEIYEPNQQVTVNATADPGWEFAGWQGASPSNEPTATLTMAGHTTVTATFAVARRLLFTDDALTIGESELVQQNVLLESAGGLQGISFTIPFNSDFLEEADFEILPAYQGILSDAVVSADSIQVVIVTMSPIPAGLQPIGTVTFRTRSTDEEVKNLDMNFTAISATDDQGNTLNEDTATRPLRLGIQRRQLIGDINNNQRHDIGDATLMLDLLFTLSSTDRPWDVTLNDVNDDGVFNQGDLLRVLNIVVEQTPAPAVASATEPIKSAQSRDATGVRHQLSRPRTAAAVDNSWCELEITPAHAYPGETVTARVVLKDLVESPIGAKLKLIYDARALQLEDATSYILGDLLPSPPNSWLEWHRIAASSGSDIETIAMAVTARESTGLTEGILAEFTFTVQPAARLQDDWPITILSSEITPDGFELTPLPLTSSKFIGNAIDFRHWISLGEGPGDPDDPDLDSDGDGRPDFHQYVFPSGANQQAAETIVHEEGGEKYLAIRYRAQRSATDITYAVYCSGNLADWHTNGDDGQSYTVEVSRTPIDETEEEVVVRCAEPISAENQQYLKVMALPVAAVE